MKWTDQSPDTILPALPAAQASQPRGRILCQTRSAPPDGAEVVIDAQVHTQVLAQLRGSRRELGGLLIGQAFSASGQTDQVTRVAVSAAVPADDSSGNGYSLRMEASVWSAANRLISLHPTQSAVLKIVGWYHSHPGLGAFFSGTDRATQAAFFNQAYSVGWVIGPSDGTHACFIDAASLDGIRCFLPGPGN